MIFTGKDVLIIKYWFKSFFKTLKLIAYCMVSRLSHIGEFYLMAGTWIGPWMFLLLGLIFNQYLMWKPFLASMFPYNTYQEEFDKARMDIAKFMLWFARFYYGYELVGMDNIPDKGGALLVYYHGAIPVDYAILISAILSQKERVVSSVIDRFLYYCVPGFGALIRAFGFHTGKRDYCIKWLKEGNLLGLAPGGAYEAQFGTTNYEIMWRKRVGFAQVAIEANVPIIPVFTENIREAVVNMRNAIEPLKRIYEITRLPFVPLYGAFPVKLKTHVGKPIYPSEDMTPSTLRTMVEKQMEKMILENQKLPGNVSRAVGERLKLFVKSLKSS